MKSLVIQLFCFALFLTKSAFASNEVVSCFIKQLLQTTEAGYAIYGEKPVYLGTFCHPEHLMPGSVQHQEANLHFLALHILKKNNDQPRNAPQNSRCILVSRENTLSSFHDFMIINRKAFSSVVQENIALFKLQFGKDISAKRLLEDLISTKDGFASLFGNKQALQGILLGYGQENSISYERAFPFKQAIISPKPSPPIAAPYPPFGKAFLQKEREQFKENTLWKKVMHETKDFDCHFLLQVENNLKIYFSFHKNAIESQELIKAYEKAQCEIDAVLSAPNFLNTTLSYLGLDAPPIEGLLEEGVNDKASNEQALAKTIRCTFDGYINSAFFKGMQEAEKLSEKESEMAFELLRPFDTVRRMSLSLKAFQENAQASKKFLELIAKKKETLCVLDKYLYIQNLENTLSKEEVTDKTASVFIKYVIKDINNSPISGMFAFDQVKKFQIKDLIPGLAHGLLGMKEGEVREIYIHPELAYGLGSDFGNGQALQIKVQLFKIERSKEYQLPFLEFASDRNTALQIKTCEEFKSLEERYSYICGLKTWLHYKKAKDVVDLPGLIKKLQEDAGPPSQNERVLVSFLNWHLYQTR